MCCQHVADMAPTCSPRMDMFIPGNNVEDVEENLANQ